MHIPSHTTCLCIANIPCDRVLLSTAGYSFSEVQSKVQPGSLDSEAGIYAMSFDQTGT